MREGDSESNFSEEVLEVHSLLLTMDCEWVACKRLALGSILQYLVLL